MNLINIGLLLAVVGSNAFTAELPVYQNPQVDLEQRVEDLLGRLTLEEKVGLLHGSFEVGGIPRLKIPALTQSDGPVGVRNPTATTALPCTLSLSCTWDVIAAQSYGRLLGEEMLALHKNVLFGPGIDLMRDPRGGRNFEYMGEDPFLTGTMAANYIQGVQATGVAACAKHLIANDCDRSRFFTSSNMGDRTLREMSLLPFEMAVRDGHVWTMMSGNNLFNGLYCAENRRLQQEIIKDELGFDGVMLTDWRAAYDPVASAFAGTDLALGGCAYVYGDGRLLDAVKAGQVPVSSIDDKVRRFLRLCFRTGVLDPSTRGSGALDTPEHRSQARQLATEGMVLLKNNSGILPLDIVRLHKVLVTGPAADMVPLGHGSGFVNSAIRITPLAGIQAALGDHATIRVIPWEKSIAKTNYAPAKQKQKDALFDANKDLGLAPDTEALKLAARESDVVIFFATDLPHGEQDDLDDINLPAGQDEAIHALAKVNTNIVVVLLTGEPVQLDSWVDRVPAILEGWYAGEATGEAVADVLTGKTSPGGRLSCTFGKRLDDYSAHALGLWPARLLLAKDPGKAGSTPKDRKPIYAFAADYQEGVFSGYRWFDNKKTEPRYPFGFGLSYTTFGLSDLTVDSSHGAIQVTCTVKNTGTREDSEVVQVYVAPPKSSVPRPLRELKGFTKVRLKPGESRQVQVALRPTALAYYDEAGKNWKADAGDYQIEVGTSSRDISLRSSVTLKTDRLYVQPNRIALDGTAGVPAPLVESGGKDGADRIKYVQQPAVEIFPTSQSPVRGTIMICPGGGYSLLSIETEGRAVAKKLNKFGYDAAVLLYHVSAGKETRNLAFSDAQSALGLIQKRGGEFGLHTNKIGVMGFSAGGHLVARLTHATASTSAPDFVVLMYPAYLEQDGQVLDEVAPLKTPAFVYVAGDDKWAPSSKAYAEACQAAKVPCVYYRKDHGGHGFGLKAKLPDDVRDWPDKLKAFLDEQK